MATTFPTGTITGTMAGTDTDVMLDETAGKVRVRYVGNPGVNAVRVNQGYELNGDLIEGNLRGQRSIRSIARPLRKGV